MPSFSKARENGSQLMGLQRVVARANLLQELRATVRQLRRLTAERHRLDLARARSDTRDWMRERRERTRHLIELGGLVQKAGLVDDDRATLLGAFLEIADQLQPREDERQGMSQADLLTRWQRCGLRAFDADKHVATE